MSKVALERLKEQFGDAILEAYTPRQGDDTAIVKPEKLREMCQFLKSDSALDFKMLMSITCVDRLHLPESTPRFELVYHLYSLSTNKRVRLKTRVEESSPELDSMVPVWRTANWWERMCWDMYGIKFRGHPNLKRIYMYEEFVGHPLRKDYPLKGRQPLIPEANFRDLVRGPGANPQRD
jgi:NADH-quinone oxidoreductase subunit C